MQHAPLAYPRSKYRHSFGPIILLVVSELLSEFSTPAGLQLLGVVALMCETITSMGDKELASVEAQMGIKKPPMGKEPSFQDPPEESLHLRIGSSILLRIRVSLLRR